MLQFDSENEKIGPEGGLTNLESTKLMTAGEFAQKSKELLGPYGPNAEGKPRKTTINQANYWANKGEVAHAQQVGTGARQQYVAPMEDWIAAALVERAPGVKGVPLPADDVILAGIQSGLSIRSIAREHSCTHTTLYRYAIKRGWIEKKMKAPR